MTRPIDADDLMDWSETVQLTDDGGIDINDFEEKLKSMPTVDAEPQWIPVSERLPDDDDYKPFSYYEDGAVLFSTKNGKVGFGWYYESTKEWANEDDRTPGEVVAWMPLPKPYEVEYEKVD